MLSPKRVASIAITMVTASIGRAANARTKLGREVRSHSTPQHNTDFHPGDWLGYAKGK